MPQCLGSNWAEGRVAFRGRIPGMLTVIGPTRIDSIGRAIACIQPTKGRLCKSTSQKMMCKRIVVFFLQHFSGARVERVLHFRRTTWRTFETIVSQATSGLAQCVCLKAPSISGCMSQGRPFLSSAIHANVHCKTHESQMGFLARPPLGCFLRLSGVWNKSH